MIVFGGGERAAATAALVARLRDDCAALPAAAGLERRARLTDLLLTAGELAQGLLDDAFARRGQDDWGELEERCAALTLRAAEWLRPGAAETASAASVLQALDALCRLPLPERLRVKVPEGYAFYALYPELYALAAEGQGPLVVLGLRSIGTSLAAVVAAAAGSPTLPVTLRPTGHPFRRTLSVGPRLEQALSAHVGDVDCAVVDEGPGLSGSSMGAAADWLESRGVAPERVHFFPGHGGDLGPQADPRHRQRWRRAARHVVPFEALLTRPPFAAAPWFEDGTPVRDLAPEDVAGGKWRAQLYPDERSWPPAHPRQERRKYLYRAGGRTWLAKFAGLGRHGDAAWECGRRLDKAGLIPPLRGLRHGFLVGEWLSAARPLPLLGPEERPPLGEGLARYLAFRVTSFPAGDDVPGASPAQLFEMARVNTAERFGEEVAALLDRWREHLGPIAGWLRRVRTDNRLHAWEWLALPDGRLVKTDALDHHAAHDLIGAQDIAWDVVGAEVELGLSAAEQHEVDERLARTTAYRPDSLVRDFYRLAYLAFQLGYYDMAAAAATSEEAPRLRAAAERYASPLYRGLTALVQ